MNRYQFKIHASVMYPDYEEIIHNDEEPFWIPEVRDGWKASHFVETKCVPRLDKFGAGHKHYFWEWCKMFLTKPPMCFMTNAYDNKELWGFNTEEDMLLFLLKWS